MHLIAIVIVVVEILKTIELSIKCYPYLLLLLKGTKYKMNWNNSSFQFKEVGLPIQFDYAMFIFLEGNL